MKKFFSFLLAIALFGSVNAVTSTNKQFADPDEVVVFLTIGQSNADGSAEFNPEIDSLMRRWYESDRNRGGMKMWYRPSYIVNQKGGERWVFDAPADSVDAPAGWMDLWYRNENTLGRTAMNMIHAYGTWSTGNGFACAQGRRGMEPEFGIRFRETFPDKDIYFIKLGCSGSQIKTWSGADDSHNWNYFFENVWKPAITSLIEQGKKPRLAGIWWMQGCGDAAKSEEYYADHLAELIRRCRADLGFPDARFYIGHVVAPGESEQCPVASVQFGPGVRAAQDAITNPQSPRYIENTAIVDTKGLTFQTDRLHFNHSGINTLADRLASMVLTYPETWAEFVAPEWLKTEPAK